MVTLLNKAVHTSKQSQFIPLKNPLNRRLGGHGPLVPLATPLFHRDHHKYLHHSDIFTVNNRYKIQHINMELHILQLQLFLHQQ